MQKIRQFGKSLFFFLLIPGIVYLFFGILKPQVFFSGSTLYSIALSSCITTVVGWGISFSMTAGIIDFSVAAERVLGAVIGVMLSRTMGIPGLVLGSIAVAVVFGIIKAVLNSFIQISSMVISVAYCYIIGSIGAVVQGNNPMILTSDMCALGQAPWIWVIFFACGAVIYVLQRYSVFGAKCRALGGNSKIAANSGISKGRTEGLAIFIASIFVGISGIMATSYGAGTAAQTGLGSMAIVFPAMIGFFIGNLLRKHVNITFGIFSGVMTMQVLANGLVSLGIPSQLKDTATGAFLLLLLCLTAISSRRNAEKLRRQASQRAAA